MLPPFFVTYEIGILAWLGPISCETRDPHVFLPFQLFLPRIHVTKIGAFKVKA